MGASDFDNVFKVGRFFGKRITQRLDGRDKRAVNLYRTCHTNGGRKAVIGGLGVVDMVVGVDGLISAFWTPCDFIGSVGDDFIHVHVGLRARASLPYNERKLVGKPPCNHFITRLHYQITLAILNSPKLGIDNRRTFFDGCHGNNQRAWQRLAPDFKIITATLSLSPKIGIGRDLHFAHRVFFDTKVGHKFSLFGG